MLLIAAIMILIGGCLLLSPWLFLSRTKKNRSPKTYELQIKLYKACILQGSLVLILIIIPASIWLLIYWFQIPGTAIYTHMCFVLPSLHGPVDLFVIGCVLSLL
jgi:hypothetical protein